MESQDQDSVETHSWPSRFNCHLIVDVSVQEFEYNNTNYNFLPNLVFYLMGIHKCEVLQFVNKFG